MDVLVVGGGITGAWVALEAASRGLDVALIERADLASGTSGQSSKLAHGGLRYLAQLELGLAWESAVERATLIDVSAPHLVRPLPMVIPLGRDLGRAAGARLEAGIRVGDRLRAAAGTHRRRLPPLRRISTEEAVRLAPALARDGLRGALLHWDAQLEDDARLVLAVARTAAAHGARILTYVRAQRLHADGATAVDERTGTTVELRARHVVNAAGVWSGELTRAIALRPSKGAHLLVPAARLGHPRAAVSVPLPDAGVSRFAFAIPRPDDLVLIGLTDTPYEPTGSPPAAPAVDAHEERALLDAVGRALDRPLAPADVVGRYAGLRPLLADPEARGAHTADLSRRHAVVEHDGVVAVVGGKLTTARRMAQDAVDRLLARAGADALAARPSVTRRLPLVGATLGRAATDAAPPRLVRRYGAEAARVVALADRPADLAPLADDVPVCRAELRFAVTHELALTVDDLLDRRTRLGLVPARRAAARAAAEDTLAAAPAVR